MQEADTSHRAANIGTFLREHRSDIVREWEQLARALPRAEALPHDRLLDGIPASKSHNGGRIAFGPENYLWVATGDAELDDRAEAQDLESLAGKVLRLRADGTAATRNPDLGPDADPRIYTAGPRNPRGIAWLPDGSVVVTEHGPAGFDEVNRLEPGANYGWPDVRHGDEYRDHPDVHRPVLSTRWNTWAPSGAVFYDGDAVPAWRNRLVVGGLVSQQVIVVTLARAGDTLPPTDADDAMRHDAEWYETAYVATSHPTLRHVLGRVRHVTQSPGGDLYAITSNRDGRARGPFPREHDDVLVRLEP
jgi:glucose/arabinose dehydrogenase